MFIKGRARRYPPPMFIRRAKIRTTESGDVYYSYRLVRNERSGDRVRQHTLLNLGSDFPLERRHWPVLCARIQQLLERQGELVPLSCPQEVERMPSASPRNSSIAHRPPQSSAPTCRRWM